MRQKSQEKDLKKMLPLKLLFLSYIKNYENTLTVSDCYNAINDRISKLASHVEENHDEISQILREDETNKTQSKSKQATHTMQIIEEQDYGMTERSNDEIQFTGDKKKSSLIKKFNQTISLVQKTTSKFQEIMFMYKNEIKQIAKDLTKEKEHSKKLSKQLLEKNKQFKETKSLSLNKFSGNKTSQPPLHPKSQITHQNKITKKDQKQVESEDQQVRSPPKPFCQQCMMRQKDDKLKEKQDIEQKNKWRQLSSKIANLKDQLSRYQQQLIAKQTEINRLSEELKKKAEEQTKTQNEQKKKLRSMNTTLRGEKIVLENHLQSLRKKTEQQQEYMTTLQSENKRLKMEKDNLQSTIKWHSNTIQDLRKNFSTGLQQQSQLITKYNQSEEANKVLYDQIVNQQNYLEEFVQKLRQVEENNHNQVEKLLSKIKELQGLIEQKNETIVKLKIRKDQNNSLMSNLLLGQRQSGFLSKENNSVKRDNMLSGTIMNKTLKKQMTGHPSSYQSNQSFQQSMVKILNKKLVDKESEIQKLQRENDVLKAELQIYKQSY